MKLNSKIIFNSFLIFLAGLALTLVFYPSLATPVQASSPARSRGAQAAQRAGATLSPQTRWKTAAYRAAASGGCARTQNPYPYPNPYPGYPQPGVTPTPQNDTCMLYLPLVVLNNPVAPNATPTPTRMATLAPTATNTPRPTNTPTNTPTPTPTNTPTRTPTNTPTRTPTSTPTRTPTPTNTANPYPYPAP